MKDRFRLKIGFGFVFSLFVGTLGPITGQKVKLIESLIFHAGSLCGVEQCDRAIYEKHCAKLAC